MASVIRGEAATARPAFLPRARVSATTSASSGPGEPAAEPEDRSGSNALEHRVIVRGRRGSDCPERGGAHASSPVDHRRGSVFLVFLVPVAQAQLTTVLAGATLFDGTGVDPVEDSVVVILGDRIMAVGPRDSVKIPESSRVIDVSGRWIVPGLVDSHIQPATSSRVGSIRGPMSSNLRSVRSYEREMEEVGGGP